MTGKEVLLQKGFVLKEKGKVHRYEKIEKETYTEQGIIVIHNVESKTVTVESYYDDKFSSRYSGMRTLPLDAEWLDLLKSLLAGE